MIGVKILDTNLNVIALFEPPLEDSQIMDLLFSEQLDGIGTAKFYIKTQSSLRSYLQMNNIVEIIDFSSNENVIYRGWIRNHRACNDRAKITLNQLKDALNNVILTSTGTITSISQLSSVIGLPFILNEPDITFDGIEYRVGQSVYSLLEEVRKATDYSFDYDGQTVTFGRLGIDRTDIGFNNTVAPGDCTQDSGDIFIDNICSEQSVQYDKVIAYNSNGDFAIAGSGRVQVPIYSDADNVVDLQLVSDETLERGVTGRIITFDTVNMKQGIVNIGDKLEVSIQDLGDTRDIDTEVFILRLETRQKGCNLLTKVFVSETKVFIRDQYNVINDINNKVNVLQTR